MDNLVGLHLDLARGLDRNRHLGAVARVGLGVLDRVHNVHALHDSSEHDVTAIQPAGLDSGDEELQCVVIDI